MSNTGNCALSNMVNLAVNQDESNYQSLDLAYKPLNAQGTLNSIRVMSLSRTERAIVSEVRVALEDALFELADMRLISQDRENDSALVLVTMLMSCLSAAANQIENIEKIERLSPFNDVRNSAEYIELSTSTQHAANCGLDHAVAIAGIALMGMQSETSKACAILEEHDEDFDDEDFIFEENIALILPALLPALRAIAGSNGAWETLIEQVVKTDLHCN